MPHHPKDPLVPLEQRQHQSPQPQRGFCCLCGLPGCQGAVIGFSGEKQLSAAALGHEQGLPGAVRVPLRTLLLGATIRFPFPWLQQLLEVLEGPGWAAPPGNMSGWRVAVPQDPVSVLGRSSQGSRAREQLWLSRCSHL